MKIDEKKEISGAVFFVPWLATYQGKKIQKTAILLVQELIKYGPILTLIFSIFREREKGKLYIPKKVGHSTFKEIL